MSDQNSDPFEANNQESEIGAPDWDARENASDDESDLQIDYEGGPEDNGSDEEVENTSTPSVLDPSDQSISSDIDEKEENHDTDQELGNLGEEEDSDDLPMTLMPDSSKNYEAAISEIRTRYRPIAEKYTGAETFKTGFILPMMGALDYDIFNPEEVEPIEGDGRHIGYLAKKDDIIFAVALQGIEPDREVMGDIVALASNNRLRFQGYVDSEDEEAGWVTIFDIDLNNDGPIDQVRLLARDDPKKDQFITLAGQMRNNEEIVLALRAEIQNPSSAFVEAIRSRLESMGHNDISMLKDRLAASGARLIDTLDNPNRDDEENEEDGERQLTGEENLAYKMIQNMLEDQIPPERIFSRPGKSYCAILLDDNNRKTIARLHFNSATVKYVGTFVGRDETRQRINSANNIDNHQDLIVQRAEELDPGAFA